MKFYSHNDDVFYSKIFYLWFYDFSTYTILTVILWFFTEKFNYDFMILILWSKFRRNFRVMLKSWFWPPYSNVNWDRDVWESCPCQIQFHHVVNCFGKLKTKDLFHFIQYVFCVRKKQRRNHLFFKCNWSLWL